MRRRRSRAASGERGMALLAVTAFAFIVIAVGLAYLSGGSDEARNAQQRLTSARAFWLAEAGSQRLAAELWADASWAGNNLAKTDTLTGGSYTLSIRDTTVGGAPAYHVVCWGTVQGVGDNTQRRLDLAVNTRYAVYTNQAAVAGSNVDFTSGTAIGLVTGSVHADGAITVPAGKTIPSSWTQGSEMNPPPLYTSPADSMGGASTTTYYYVRGFTVPSVGGEILDRNGNSFVPKKVLPAGVGVSFKKGVWAFDLVESDLDWVTSQFKPAAGATAVVVNFGEYQTADVTISTGGADIKSTVVNTRYTGPGGAAARLNPANWTGGTTSVKKDVGFAPANGVAIAVYDLNRASGGSGTTVGTPAAPALVYATHDVDLSGGDVTFTGTLMALGSMSVGAKATLTYAGGYAAALPKTLGAGRAPGATARTALLSWKDIARQ